jgi:hypothetical protein
MTHSDAPRYTPAQDVHGLFTTVNGTMKVIHPKSPTPWRRMGVLLGLFLGSSVVVVACNGPVTEERYPSGPTGSGSPLNLPASDPFNDEQGDSVPGGRDGGAPGQNRDASDVFSNATDRGDSGEAKPLVDAAVGSRDASNSQPTKCSVESKEPAQIRIEVKPNSGSFELVWADYNCKEVAYATLASGATKVINSYATHEWRAYKAGTTTLLKTIKIPSGTTQITVSLP